VAIARIAQPGRPDEIKADVMVAHPSTHSCPCEIVTAPKRTNDAVIVYVFFVRDVGINIRNATTDGTLTDIALPAALGILAEAVVFFLPSWAPAHGQNIRFVEGNSDPRGISRYPRR
jgi:hypothetical protein